MADYSSGDRDGWWWWVCARRRQEWGAPMSAAMKATQRAADQAVAGGVQPVSARSTAAGETVVVVGRRQRVQGLQVGAAAATAAQTQAAAPAKVSPLERRQRAIAATVKVRFAARDADGMVWVCISKVRRAASCPMYLCASWKAARARRTLTKPLAGRSITTCTQAAQAARAAGAVAAATPVTARVRVGATGQGRVNAAMPFGRPKVQPAAVEDVITVTPPRFPSFVKPQAGFHSVPTRHLLASHSSSSSHASSSRASTFKQKDRSKADVSTHDEHIEEKCFQDLEALGLIRTHS